MARDDTDMDGIREGAIPTGIGRPPPDRVHADRGPPDRLPWTLRAVPPPVVSPTALALAGPHAAVASGAMEPEEVARVTLAALRQRHHDLDVAIRALQDQGTDPLSVRRLKKRKLALRDRIAAIEDRLTPDIIA